MNPNKPRYNSKWFDVELAKHLYFSEHLPFVEVGKRLGVAGQTVRYRFKALGVINRDRGEAQLGRKRPYLSRELNPNWKGGKSRTSGYVKLNSNLREHRIIAENVLGRKLKPSEVVHHIDGNGYDNSNSNLLICTQSYHVFLHKQMEGKHGSADRI